MQHVPSISLHHDPNYNNIHPLKETLVIYTMLTLERYLYYTVDGDGKWLVPIARNE